MIPPQFILEIDSKTMWISKQIQFHNMKVKDVTPQSTLVSKERNKWKKK